VGVGDGRVTVMPMVCHWMLGLRNGNTEHRQNSEIEFIIAEEKIRKHVTNATEIYFDRVLINGLIDRLYLDG
jgi:hypothetical protein